MARKMQVMYRKLLVFFMASSPYSEKIEHRTSNVQLPTSNVEGATLYLSLNSANFRMLNRSFRRTVRPGTHSQMAQSNRISKRRFDRTAHALPLRQALSLRVPRMMLSFFKIDRIHYSMLDVGRSMLDVH
jgi:hypothetical protein